MIKHLVTAWLDRREEVPRSAIAIFSLWTFYATLFLLLLWAVLWLPRIDVETARWTLSAQVQATAAIFGLLIAAMAFRWRRVTEEEHRLQSNIYSYLRSIALSSTGPQKLIPTIKVVYDDYLAWVNTEKPKIDESAYIHLGRLWVIMQLSYVYRTRIKFGRYLKRGQTRGLAKVSKLSRESAIDMWESYYRDPAGFILNMHETLDNVSILLTGVEMKNNKEKNEHDDKDVLSGKYATVGQIVSSMVIDDSINIADEIKKRRQSLQPFHIASLILASAIIVGLVVLSGISKENSLLNMNPSIIWWVVGIPVSLSVLGVSYCLLLIRSIWR